DRVRDGYRMSPSNYLSMPQPDNVRRVSRDDLYTMVRDTQDGGGDPVALMRVNQGRAWLDDDREVLPEDLANVLVAADLIDLSWRMRGGGWDFGGEASFGERLHTALDEMVPSRDKTASSGVFGGVLGKTTESDIDDLPTDSNNVNSPSGSSSNDNDIK